MPLFTGLDHSRVFGSARQYRETVKRSSSLLREFVCTRLNSSKNPGACACARSVDQRSLACSQPYSPVPPLRDGAPQVPGEDANSPQGHSLHEHCSTPCFHLVVLAGVLIEADAHYTDDNMYQKLR